MNWRTTLRCGAAVSISLLTGCVTTDINTIAPPAAGGTAQLSRGRSIYVNQCTKCHAPEPVHKYTRAQWDEIMPDMVEESNLNDSDAAAVMAYVKSLVMQ